VNAKLTAARVPVTTAEHAERLGPDIFLVVGCNIRSLDLLTLSVSMKMLSTQWSDSDSFPSMYL
jgi:hypothetical protein